MNEPPIPKPRRNPNNYENVTRPVPSSRNLENLSNLRISQQNQKLQIDDLPVPTSTQDVKLVKNVQKSLINSTKHVRNKFTKSFIDTKNTSSKHPISPKKKDKLNIPQEERSVSMPSIDVQVFDNIQFNSPLAEQNLFKHLPFQNMSTAKTDMDSSNIFHGNQSPVSSYSSSTLSSANVTLGENDELYNIPRNDTSSSNSWSFYDQVSSSSLIENKVVSYKPSVPPRPSQPNCDDKKAIMPQVLNYSSVPSIGNVLTEEKRIRPSGSVIMEFDPLASVTSSREYRSPNLILLESLITGELDRSSMFQNSYKVTNLEPDTDMDEFYWDESVSYLSPPTPPERHDSLFHSKSVPLPKSEPNVNKNRSTISEGVRSTVCEGSNNSLNSNRPSSSIVKEKLSSMLKMVPESASYLKKRVDLRVTNNAIPSKLTLLKTDTFHQGKMVRFLPGGIEEIFKSFALRVCSLTCHKITFMQDKNMAKEVYNLKTFYSIQIILFHKFNYDGELHCFQINFANLGAFNMNRGTVIFGCINESERNVWIRKIVEMFSSKFPTKYITELTRFGWAYIKEGVSGAYDVGWLLLSQRVLLYYTSQDANIRQLDLRKARFVVLRECDDKNFQKENGPMLVLDHPDVTLYLRMGSSRETTLWHKIIKAVAANNGSSIHHQQLTKSDVPTIVEKCINFIYLQGSLSVGIYRKAGSNIQVSQLLEEFRSDAWAVQLVARTYSEHDVATVLKRFFRDLPEPLLTVKLLNQFCAVAALENQQEKIDAYKELIKLLYPINQNTLKKLLGHLHFIQSLAEENCMNIKNLATVWGPTLILGSAGVDSKLQNANEVMADLITLYIPIYEPSAVDTEKEKKMLTILKQCQNVSNPIQKRSGDLHVWIYLYEKQAGNCINVVLVPGRTSGEVCIELSSKVDIEAHLLLLEEVICGESMRRPLHHKEILLDVVLRWGYWDEADRKDNYLVLKGNIILQEAMVAQEPQSGLTLIREMKFANEKCRTFQHCILSFRQASLKCYKDKVGGTLLGSWNIEDIRWYTGHETKRNPPCRWTITFIKKEGKPLRSKNMPWFGCTMTSHHKDDYLNWINAFMHAEFSGSLLPPPQLIIP